MRALAFTDSSPAGKPETRAPEAAPPLVRLSAVNKRFGGVTALDDISLSVASGEVLGIIGRSGAGKSTLIRCLNGLERPDSGSVEVVGRDITRLSEAELQPVRRRIGMIFQHFNLLSAKTVAENVGLPLKIAGRKRADRARRVADLLELVGLADKAHAYPVQLSGGQKQRVGIARALASDPVLLLSDEATSALDPETTTSILDLLRDINRRLHLTIVLITHEVEVIRSIADRVIVLERGRIIESGPVWRVFASPEAAGTQRLLQSVRPELPASIRARLRPDPGEGLSVVVRIEVHGAEARRPLFSELSDGSVLLHGGIEHVQDQPVGTLFVSLPNGDGQAVARAREVLGDRAALEVLGYVRHDG